MPFTSTRDKIQRIIEIMNNGIYRHDKGLQTELFQILASLSEAEHEVLNKEVQGTELDNLLYDFIISEKYLSIRQKVEFFDKRFPNHNHAKPMLRTLRKITDVLSYNRFMDQDKLVQWDKNFTILQDLADRDIIDEWLIPLLYDYLELQNSKTENAICDYFERIIETSDDFGIIEEVATAWNKILPEIAVRRLRRITLESQKPKLKSNARRALVILGEDTVGDTYNIIGNTQTIITINSVLEHTSQKIADSSIDQITKDELENLIERLNEELKQVPEEQAEEAKAVAEITKDLVEKATQEKPNKTSVKITAEGLLKAAENIGKIAPKVIAIAKQIVALLVS